MRYLVIALLLILSSLSFVPAHAQGCAVCTQTAQGLDDKSAKGLNGGILYLAFIPLGILGTIGTIWWRHYGSPSKQA